MSKIPFLTPPHNLGLFDRSSKNSIFSKVKYYIFLILIPLLFYSCRVKEAKPNEWMKPVRQATVLLQTYKEIPETDSIIRRFGMGFLVQGSTPEVAFLVTCRHLLPGIKLLEIAMPETEEFIPCYSEDYAYRIPWIGHPDTTLDIAVLPCSTSSFNEQIVSLPNHYIEKQQTIAEGDEVFFLTSYQMTHLGKSVYISTIDTSAHFMLLNRGIVSRISPLKAYKKRGIFFITPEIRGGNSGAPVFVRSKKPKTSCLVIGILSEHFEGNSVLISSDKIKELLDRF